MGGLNSPAVDIPGLGARTALWISAELHLFLAALILGAPMFVVICEYLGYRLKDYRYERLSKETMKVVSIAYSFTAITGTVMAFILMSSFQQFSNFIFAKFAPVWGIYILLILVEVALMYLYWYSWDPLKDKKPLHIGIGVALNVVGTVVMLLMNAVGSYMLTPPAKETGLWSIINNPSWFGLNLHRFIANITFGGFVVALFAAFMYLISRKDEDKAFYDWMGYIGTLIGVGTLMLLPLAGYVYTKELFEYDAGIATFQMGDKLAPGFVIQGLLITMIFLGVNYYMWVSITRIEGAGRFLRYRTPVFVALLILGALWIIPANMLPDINTSPPEGMEADYIIPDRAIVLSLMVPKALAVTGILFFTFLTYMIYHRAIRTGSITWGSIPAQGQYALVVVATSIIYLMGLMGAIREFSRQDWHVYQVMKDASPYWYTSPLSYISAMTSVVTLLFFILLAFIFWVGFLMQKKQAAAGVHLGEEKEGVSA